jgi:peptide/nickel transport system substrate-binding protein
LEAANSSGWCLTETELAISGIQVAKTIYDTLVAPNADGDYVPFLAESVESNEDFTEWTIKLRDGVVFHDDSALTAEVVKNNLDAYRGEYPARKPLLFLFVFDNIESVDVVDDLTVSVTTKTPWAAFPAHLYGSGRIGIMAQAQLDDPETCDTNLIGTGPFEIENWSPGDTFSAVRNDNYWMTDSEGNELPYLDRVEYRTFTEPSVRNNALLSGEINALHNPTPESTEQMLAEQDSGNVKVTESDQGNEVNYLMFNVSHPPFDSLVARQAVAYAVNRDELRETAYLGINQIASGPFAPGVMGYLEDTGMPAYDQEHAAELAAEYEESSGEEFRFTAPVLNSTESLGVAQLVQAQLKEAGITMDIRPVEQAAEIETALGDDWEMLMWRNHPGGDPDTQYVWWHSGLPSNFNKLDDPEVDRLLEAGRTTTDLAERPAIYEELNRYFAEQQFNFWTVWTNWIVATAPDVQGIHGIFGPDMPDGSAPNEVLATGHYVTGIWITE